MDAHALNCITCNSKVCNVRTKWNTEIKDSFWKVKVGENAAPDSKFALHTSSCNGAVKTWRYNFDEPYELERCCEFPEGLCKEVMTLLEKTNKNAKASNIFNWHLRVRPEYNSYDLRRISGRVPMYFETKPASFYRGDIGNEIIVEDVFDDLSSSTSSYEVDEYECAIPTIAYLDVHTVHIGNPLAPHILYT